MQNNNTQLKEIFRLIGEGNSKKILFACVPGDGHFNPLTGIAKYLQSLGYDIRWYTSAAYSKKLEKLQIPHYPFKRALEVTGETADTVFPERKELKNPVKKLNYDIINFFIKRGPEYYVDMLDIYKSFSFDLVIADVAFSAIPFITDKMNIPVLSIGVFPLTETSKDLAPAGLGITPSKTFFGRRRQDISRFIAGKILFRKSNIVMKKVMGEYSISTDNANIFDLLVKKSTFVLQSGTPGFEYFRSDLGKNIRFIGPLLPYKKPGNKDVWFDGRLISYKKIIVVTQGTVERDVEKIMVPTLEAFKNTDILVVATTGGSQTAALRERFPESNIIIEDFIPFEDIMPYANVYITNGGYGGVMLGIENELPLVVAGVHEGKNEINARIGYFNLGINLKTETPSVLQMRSAVDEVIKNSIYKKNVVKLSKEFKNYDPNILITKCVKEVLERPKRNMAAKATATLYN